MELGKPNNPSIFRKAFYINKKMYRLVGRRQSKKQMSLCNGKNKYFYTNLKGC